jgi:hypothetical protein
MKRFGEYLAEKKKERFGDFIDLKKSIQFSLLKSIFLQTTLPP